MRSVRYYMAPCLNDSTVYSIRAKTKKEIVEKLKACNPDDYGPIQNVIIEYKDSFDLVMQILDEGNYGSY